MINQSLEEYSLSLCAKCCIHDILSPLTSIMLGIDLLTTKHGATKEVTELLDASKSIKTYYKNMSSLLRGQSSTSEILFKKHIEIIIKLLYSHAIVKGVRFTTLSNQSSPFSCDPVIFQRIILNILVNAIESFNPKQNIKNVSCSINEYPQKFLITITDNGSGIDPSYIHSINTPSYTTKESHSGLGFTSIYRQVKHLNGQITVSSRKNEWTKISVTLPRE